MGASTAIVDIDLIDAAAGAVEAKFQEVFEGDSAEGVSRRFVEILPAATKQITHSLLGAMPVLEKWEGAKKFRDTRAYAQTLELGRHTMNLRMTRFDLRYDPTGLAGRRVAQFGRQMRRWYDKLAFDEVMITNPLGYDGVALFASTHPHGPAGANQSNTGASALSVSALDSTLISMTSLQDENSEPMEINPSLLVVGQKNAKRAQEITGSTRLYTVDAAGVPDGTGSQIAAAYGANEYFGGMLNVLVWPRLVGTYDDYWFVIDENHPAKPVVVYEGRSPELVPMVDMNGVQRFMKDELLWSVESDDVSAAGAWQTVYRHAL